MTTDSAAPRAQRADAQRNYQRILDIARIVVAEQGTEASLRDVARRAEVGLGTLYRHFPTRDALLEALMREGFERLAARAAALGESAPPLAALREWLADFAVGSARYRGLSGSILATLSDEESPLHAACLAMREGGARLLARAQASGDIRDDIDGTDLFALVTAVGWIADQAPAIARRQEHLLSVVLDGLAPRNAVA
ncbi:AcrR family transcriptional regulator [Allocatelliglobosispora scoriae]|uniref:AcrR family transcriptional regulator n=1 Tax=Allocatelliglobosispora scoriae TaxID=643052 RepID=A0A841C595_9ACTN|nr:TetR/AcrR family transcriptional regulator [Allocatelliglobosispora scoriae]MBB5874242.1 AcrR family transcriptional regulator [Allocatelliglobosispora scoriae]